MLLTGMLSSLLSGAAYGTESGNMVDGAIVGVDGQFFIAIDVAAFTDPAAFAARVDGVRDQVHNSRRRAGVERLYVPGELEAEYEERAAHGILLAGQTINDIFAEAERLNVDAARLAAQGEGRHGDV